MSSEKVPARGLLFVVSAPSGTGKTTVVERLAERVGLPYESSGDRAHERPQLRKRSVQCFSCVRRTTQTLGEARNPVQLVLARRYGPKHSRAVPERAKQQKQAAKRSAHE